MDRFEDAAPNETSSISRELMQEPVWMFGQSTNLFREVFSSRLDGLRAIRIRDHELAKRTANKLEVFARVYREYSPSRDLITLSKAYKCLTKLYKWLDSIRNSKKKPEKHLESAQFIAEETLASELGQCTDDFNLLFQDIATVTDLEGVIGVENKLKVIPVPLSVSTPPYVDDSSKSISLESKPDYDEKIGVVSFWLNGREAKTLNILAPKILHDVVMEINVPYWPMNAKNLIVEATSTTNSKYFDLPSFQFSKPIDDAIEQTLKLERKMVLKVEQDLNAEPIEFKFTASYDDSQGESLDLTGQDTLRIFSSTKKPATVLDEVEKIEQRIGSFSGNDKAIEIFVQLQNNYEVPKEDTLAVLAVLDNLMKLANLSLRYGIFAVGTKEEIFQKEVLRNMQQIPKLADDLHEQVKTGNGIVDLMFRGCLKKIRETGRKYNFRYHQL